MPIRHSSMAVAPALLVLITACLVHAPGHPGAQTIGTSPATAAGTAQIASGRGEAGLPEPVLQMREAILEAVRSGRLSDLQTAIELNEIKPDIAGNASGDQIAALRALSADGSGEDVLVSLGRILDAPWAAVPMGRDLENNRVYVWPTFAVTGTKALSPEAAADLALIVGSEVAQSMRQSGLYTQWRIAIAADGTWHYLRK